jgi:hypothetical protein
MRYESQDLGRWTIKVDTITQDDIESKHILVLSDCDETGLIHIYYGPSLPKALESVSDILAGMPEQQSIVKDVVTFFNNYEPRFLSENL